MSNLKNEDLVNTAEILSNAFLELSQNICAVSENLKKTVDYLQKLDKDKNNNFEKSYTTVDVDFDRIIERIKENEEKRNSKVSTDFNTGEILGTIVSYRCGVCAGVFPKKESHLCEAYRDNGFGVWVPMY